MENSEETPLLNDNAADSDVQTRHEAVYRRFSPARKRTIVGLVSVCGLIPRTKPPFVAFYIDELLIGDVLTVFVTGTFTPSIPTIAKDFDSTGPIVKYVNARRVKSFI